MDKPAAATRTVYAVAEAIVLAELDHPGVRLKQIVRPQWARLLKLSDAAYSPLDAGPASSKWGRFSAQRVNEQLHQIMPRSRACSARHRVLASQADFGEAQVVIGGIEHKAHDLVVDLSLSQAIP